jgi:hypothetical protein
VYLHAKRLKSQIQVTYSITIEDATLIVRPLTKGGYNMNYNEKIALECTCESISSKEWDSLMKGAKKANGSKIRRMIKEQLPELYNSLNLQFPNPYEKESKKTSTHYIYVWSAIEFFLINLNPNQNENTKF